MTPNVPLAPDPAHPTVGPFSRGRRLRRWDWGDPLTGRTWSGSCRRRDGSSFFHPLTPANAGDLIVGRQPWPVGARSSGSRPSPGWAV